MTIVVLFDVDGVVIKKRKGYFSDEYCREHDVPPEEVHAFFKNEFRQCQVGKADLKKELTKYLARWKWHGSAEEFMQYWFDNDADFDQKVLATAAALQARGVQVYLNANQEKYRKEYLLGKLQGTIEGGFFSCDLGVPKSDPQFFKKVVERLGIEPREIVYFDDDQPNVDSAKSVGIDARLYTSPQQLQEL